MKNRKILAIIISVLIIMPILIIYKVNPLLGSKSGFAPSSKKIESFFKQEKYQFDIIKDYFFNIKYDARWESISTDEIKYYWKNNIGGIEITEKKIDKQDILQAIQNLKKNNVEVISKHRNYVEFSFWSSLDSSCGLIYCDSEPVIEYNGKTELKALSWENWYYYMHIAD